MGAGVVDQLRHGGFGTGLYEFHGGARAFAAEAYFNRRAECWGLMAAWLKAGAQIPDDPRISRHRNTATAAGRRSSWNAKKI